MNYLHTKCRFSNRILENFPQFRCLIGQRQLSSIRLRTKVKSVFARATALLVCLVLAAGLAPCRAIIIITNDATLNAAVAAGGASIFGPGVTITLSNAPDGLEITTNLLLYSVNSPQR